MWSWNVPTIQLTFLLSIHNIFLFPFRLLEGNLQGRKYSIQFFHLCDCSTFMIWNVIFKSKSVLNSNRILISLWSPTESKTTFVRIKQIYSLAKWITEIKLKRSLTRQIDLEKPFHYVSCQLNVWHFRLKLYILWALFRN